MFSYIWPVVMVVVANTLYQICAEAFPPDINPLAPLTVSYFTAFVLALILFFLLGKGANLFKEYTNLNWAPFALGGILILLDVGFVYAYRNGWSVSTFPVVQYAILACVLVVVGYFLYQEKITWTKLSGIAACLLGIWLINK